MHCQYCGSINDEDDHRCLRCGRRIKGIAISVPTSYFGATALAVETSPEQEVDVSRRHVEQVPLFRAPGKHGEAAQNIIPFEQIPRRSGRSSPAAPAPVPPQFAPPRNGSEKKPVPRTPAKRQVPEGQGSLDLRSGASQNERILTTGVPAQVYGDGRVAPPMRRVTAGALDVSMVLLGFGSFALAARFIGPVFGAASGASFGSGKAIWITLVASLILFSVFYGALWALARRETAGMHWTDLHLVTFDGWQPDGRERAIRFAAAWLSYCSGGLGLIWALVDEESLAFHDHISKTYPAEKVSACALVRPRK